MSDDTAEHPNLITTPFGFDSTAAEVVEGIDLTSSQAIVTGGASGIGVEIARALAGAGASVTLAVRSPATAKTPLACRMTTCPPNRRHSALGWAGPLEFETEHRNRATTPHEPLRQTGA